MRVEEDYPEEDGHGDDGHARKLGQKAAPGQLSGGEGQLGVNSVPVLGNETGVTALATIGLTPSLGRAPRAASSGVDERLLGRAASGDPAAFRELFIRHRADVARLVYRMASHGADVEDIVQEVFVQVYRSLKDFRGQSKFSTWLHRVTVNVVLMHRRSARSRPVLTEEAPSDFVADERQLLPDEEAERSERTRAFQRLLSRLAEKKRVVFVLHELEGLSPTEIAEIVGAPALTVRTRLFYARRELEAMLADEPSLVALGASFTKEGA